MTYLILLLAVQVTAWSFVWIVRGDPRPVPSDPAFEAGHPPEAAIL